MGMRGLLGLLRRDGTVRYMYVQWGGELEAMVRVMKRIVNVGQLRELVAFNSASSIDHRTLAVNGRHEDGDCTTADSLETFMESSYDNMLEGVYCYVPEYPPAAVDAVDDAAVDDDDNGGALPGDDDLEGEWVAATRHPFTLKLRRPGAAPAGDGEPELVLCT
jgi:hypothetical protein